MDSRRIGWSGLAGLAAASALVGLVFLVASAWDDEDGTALVATAPARGRPDRDRPELSWSRRRIYDPFPPVVRFGILAAGDVGPAIADDEFVIGVEIDGEARAYPLNMLGHPGSEVVNDTLGGQPVAVTFCGLCETPLVFSRRVDDRTLTFQVSGMVVESNMMIRDVETGSGWIQVLGRAVEGPLRAKELRRFPSVWTDWKTWRSAHPGTTAVSLLRGPRKYSRSAVVATASRDKVLDALQWGLARDGRARSWPYARLARHGVVNETFAGLPLLIAFDAETLGPVGFDRRIDGKELSFRRRGAELVDEATGSTWDPVTGRALGGPLAGRRLSQVAGTIATTRTWAAFHPDTEVWDPGV